MPLDDSVNVILVVLEGLFMQIPHWRGIINNVGLVVCWLDAHIFFPFLIKQTDIIFKNEN